MKRAILAAVLPLALTAPAAAQDYPARPIQLIVPTSAGGPADTVARIVADHLGKELNQRITVVNKPGAGGEIGMTEIAAANPDGYTLGIFGYPDNVIIELTRETTLSGDSFEYLASFDSMPMGIYAAPEAPFSDVEGMQKHFAEKGGKAVFGEAGGLALLAAVAFADAAKLGITTVNFSGGGESLNALLGSHVDAISTGIMSTEPVLTGGGKLLGFTSAERMEMFPDAPTLAEQGVDLVLGVSRVLVAPAGLDEAARSRLVAAADAISTDEAMIERFRQARLPYSYKSAEEFNATVSDTNAFYKSVVEANRAAFSRD